jgi:hypothetical protein
MYLSFFTNHKQFVVIPMVDYRNQKQEEKEKKRDKDLEDLIVLYVDEERQRQDSSDSRSPDEKIIEHKARIKECCINDPLILKKRSPCRRFYYEILDPLIPLVDKFMHKHSLEDFRQCCIPTAWWCCFCPQGYCCITVDDLKQKHEDHLNQEVESLYGKYVAHLDFPPPQPNSLNVLKDINSNSNTIAPAHQKGHQNKKIDDKAKMQDSSSPSHHDNVINLPPEPIEI